MLEMFSRDPNNAIDILKNDHDRVKKLFDKFEEAKGRSSKTKIVAKALTELKVHATLEEEIFYAAVRKKLEKKVMNEADEEHHVARVLVAELETMDGTEDHYDAKFTVLSENIRHHIKEEESDMLSKARALDIDYKALGQQMLKRKKELLSNGFPPVAEEKMVAASRGRGDSPAQKAKKTIKAPKAR
jgi:hypothetical protein